MIHADTCIFAYMQLEKWYAQVVICTGYKQIHSYTHVYMHICIVHNIQQWYIQIQSNTWRHMQSIADPFCSMPPVWSACMRMYFHVCCAYVVQILTVCCMYVHMCAYLHVSMRLALFAAKNTCTYAHTCTYCTSYMHKHFKYKQKYARDKTMRI